MVELINKRKLNSKTFDTGRTQAHPVTSKTVPIYASKLQNGLHYAENGQYKNVDTDVKVNAKYEFSHEVTKMRGIVRYGDTSANTKKHLFGVEDDNGNWLNVKLDQENHVLSTVTGNRAEFTDATHCDVKHYTLYNGVKTEYVINNKAVNSLTVTFKHNDEITPEQRGNNIVFTRDGKDIFTVKSPFAYDAAVGIDVTEPVIMTLGMTEGFHSATMVVDATWLLAATNPIIDPDVTIEDDTNPGGVIQETWMFSGSPDTNYGEHLQLRIGGVYTGLVYADLTGYENISEVITAHFGGDLYYYVGANTFTWYEVFVAWEEMQATWNDRLTSTAWNVAGCKGAGTDRNAVADGSKDVTGVDSDFQMPITPALALKMATDVNNGIVIDGGIADSFLYQASMYFYMEFTEEEAGGFPFFFGGINDD